MNEDRIDEIARLRQYAAQTERADATKIDVTADVMSTIRSQRALPQSSTTRTVFMAVAASWLVALSIGYFAQQALSEVQDPLSSLTTPFSITLE
jgi:hypothetical protein